MSTLKALINSLTDFEFLASISSIDFHNKKIFFKKHFWNTLIKYITKNVDINSERDLHAVIAALKRMSFTRLGLVSPHSMKRFFLQQIPLVFAAFEHRLKNFFKNVKPVTQRKTLSEEEKLAVKKQKKREARRRNRNNRRQRMILEDQISFEEPKSEKDDESEEATNDEKSVESTSDSENEDSTDDGIIHFRCPSDIADALNVDRSEILAIEDRYPEIYNDILDAGQVPKHVILALLDVTDDESSEEDLTESEEDEED